MPSQAFRLIFPQQLLNEPVINNLLRQYNFTLNILQASITTDKGWMDIQITGKTGEVESAITWLKNQDIEVLLLSK